MPTYKFFDHDRFRAALAFVNQGSEVYIGPCRLFGHFAMLERWLSEYHDTGELTGIEPWRIEAAAGWGPPEVPEYVLGKFYKALVESGLMIDVAGGKTIFRGWDKSAPEFVRKRVRRREAAERERMAMSGHVQTCTDDGGIRPPREGEGEGEGVLENVPSHSMPQSPALKKAAAFAAGVIEGIYQAYPRKVGKGAAVAKIRTALARISGRNGVADPAAWLLARVQAFARSPRGQAGSFCPHPATWFGQGRYDDDDAEWEREGDGAPAQPPPRGPEYAGGASADRVATESAERRAEITAANLERERALATCDAADGERLAAALEKARASMLSRPASVPDDWRKKPTWVLAAARELRGDNGERIAQ